MILSFRISHLTFLSKKIVGVNMSIVSSRLITPFLVLAVGVDDAFLMLHEWFTSAELDPSSRLNSVLVEIGPSVTLTSVTNICAFLVSSLVNYLKIFFDWMHMLKNGIKFCMFV